MIQATAYMQRIDYQNDLLRIDLHLALFPRSGAEATALIGALQQWLLKGTADLEFEDPPPRPGFAIVEERPRLPPPPPPAPPPNRVSSWRL